MTILHRGPGSDWVSNQLGGTFFGCILLGTSFTWTDFPYCFLGAALGLVLARRLQKAFEGEKSVTDR